MLAPFPNHDELRAHIDHITPFLDSLSEAIAIVDTRGVFVYYNQASAVLDGCTREFALGKTPMDLYPSMKKEDSTMLTALSGQKYIDSHTNYFNATGSLIIYQHTTLPIFGENRQIIGAIEVGHDLSKATKINNQLYQLNKRLASRLTGNGQLSAEQKIVTRSPRMHEAIEKAKQFAATQIPVIIYGESGTGKELFANLIFENSERHNKPFVVLNCGALSDNLIESSLFGTVKGAFTGAENSEGFLAMADGGTLFLDEFNSMPMPMQVKLLRFLQLKTYCRVGSSKTMMSDARIIVAMNERPEALIEKGRLRADLYWRLNVANLELPSLKDRPEDIALLAEHFIAKHAGEVSHTITGLSTTAAKALQSLEWPGNVRMLENVVLRSMVLQDHDGELETIVKDVDTFENHLHEKKNGPVEAEPSKVAHPRHITLTSTAFDDDFSFDELVSHFEKELIIEAMNRASGNTSAAAQILKMKRTTLSYKIKKYGLKIGIQNPDA